MQYRDYKIEQLLRIDNVREEKLEKSDGLIGIVILEMAPNVIIW